MVQSVPPRSELAAEYTWSVESVFATEKEWETAFQQVADELPNLERFRGHLGDNPQALADWFEAVIAVRKPLGLLVLYASMVHNVDTADQAGAALFERARGLFARAAAVTSFGDPEILQIGREKLDKWTQEEPRLAIYQHYFDRLERRREHVRSADVEEVLGLVLEPFATASATHRVLTDTDMTFEPARDRQGKELDVAQGNLRALLSSPDREVRQTAWENYADAYLALKNTMANALSAGVKQDVFVARARRYGSSIEASLDPNAIPVAVFDNLINTFRKNIPTWHRYWKVRRQALGYDELPRL